jgi:hypothetical protein
MFKELTTQRRNPWGCVIKAVCCAHRLMVAVVLGLRHGKPWSLITRWDKEAGRTCLPTRAEEEVREMQGSPLSLSAERRGCVSKVVQRWHGLV